MPALSIDADRLASGGPRRPSEIGVSRARALCQARELHAGLIHDHERVLAEAQPAWPAIVLDDLELPMP
jgi:hypothetical protein